MKKHLKKLLLAIVAFTLVFVAAPSESALAKAETYKAKTEKHYYRDDPDKEWFLSSIVKNTYDQKGRLKQVTKSYLDKNGKTTSTDKTVYTYNKYGDYTSVKVYEDGKLTQREDYKYKGKKLKSYRFRASKTDIKETYTYKKGKLKTRKIYENFSHGVNHIETYSYKGKKQTKIIRQKLSKKGRRTSNKQKTVIKYTYKGKLLVKETLRSDYAMSYTRKLTYKGNRLIKETKKNEEGSYTWFYNNKGLIEKYINGETTTLYSYKYYKDNYIAEMIIKSGLPTNYYEEDKVEYSDWEEF